MLGGFIPETLEELRPKLATSRVTRWRCPQRLRCSAPGQLRAVLTGCCAQCMNDYWLAETPPARRLLQFNRKLASAGSVLCILHPGRRRVAVLPSTTVRAGWFGDWPRAAPQSTRVCVTSHVNIYSAGCDWPAVVTATNRRTRPTQVRPLHHRRQPITDARSDANSLAGFTDTTADRCSLSTADRTNED